MTKSMVSRVTAAALLFVPLAASAALLTDIAVFSSNSEGNNWNGLIWNTQGADTDTPEPGRYNLYVSPDPLDDTSPSFANGFNDIRTRVALALAPGEQTFSIYGEGVGSQFDPLQHFVLNLYFGGIQLSPTLSGVQNLANNNLAVAGHFWKQRPPRGRLALRPNRQPAHHVDRIFVDHRRSEGCGLGLLGE
jgi:hypothetical protein